MYVPAHFAERDTAALHDFIERHSFGTLISQVDGLPFASHLPFLLERQTGAQGTLLCHLARANAQWQEADGETVLAMFTGPHAYISPSWYEAEQVVPTWNYVAVHAYGKAQLIHDREDLTSVIERMVETYERAMPHPWPLGGPSTFVDKMLAEIVGLRVPIERIEGKWKLNQNHPAERRRKVIEALRRQRDEDSLAVAALMEEKLAAQ